MKKVLKKTAKGFEGLFHVRKVIKIKTPGQAPGTLVHTGQRIVEEVLLTVHDYDENQYRSIPIKSIEKSSPFISDPSKTWVQVRGVHDVEKLKGMLDFFSIHPLIQEDILNTSQRPKIEPYDDAIYFVLRMINIKKNDESSFCLSIEQVSIVLGPNYVLSFQESDEPIFEPVIKRLEQPGTRIRKFGTDYLAYALVDTIVDYYFNVLDLINDTLEDIEDRIISNPQKIHLQQIHSLRSDLLIFKKSVWSLRDGLNTIIRDDSKLISKEVKIFMRDVFDHVVQVIEGIENSREMVYGLYDMYMSGLSNRMNEVMKVLTIIATIFIPLTFISGIYGMNFNTSASPYNMPELNWYWGYPFVVVTMVIVVILMLFYFRRKRWI